MNVWKLTAANNLVYANEKLVPEEGKQKVRVTKIFINRDDALVFNGTYRVKYPRIPGRFAVGIVTDETNSPYSKGTRVLLHSFLPEEEDGTQKPDYTAFTRRVCGLTEDGFLRDFVFKTKNDMTALPDSVNDEKALLIEYVALAKAAIDALNPQKGDHVAVIGADMLGLLVCQLLIYQQVSPILIEDRADRLDFARSCGVYYAFSPGETLLDNIADVTGGRLADGVIFADGTDDTLPFAVCAAEKTAVFCGRNENNLSLSLDSILKKQLSVHGVSDGSDYIETAINLIANKAVDLNVFHVNVVETKKLASLFKDFIARPVRPVGDIHVINLL